MSRLLSENADDWYISLSFILFLGYRFHVLLYKKSASFDPLTIIFRTQHESPECWHDGPSK